MHRSPQGCIRSSINFCSRLPVLAEGTPVTIAYAASHLGLKHNSTVELVDRSEREDLIERTIDKDDKRRAILRLTRKGTASPSQALGDHARELNEMAPRLVRALRRVQLHSGASLAQEAL